MAITRNFNLFLNAGHSVPLVINANQYDQGESWVFTLFNSNGTQYVPSTGAIVGIKSDGLGIINSGSVADGKVIITETQQMTAAPGKAVFELMIDNGTHGTANFIVLVEEKPGNNADLSESDLSLLEEAINATSPLPTGGTVGQVLTKTANGSTWSDAGTPTQEQVASAVSDWADEHITVETGVVIDTSLSVAGAAADAKKTGDEITDLKSAIEQIDTSGIPSEVRQAIATLFNTALYLDDSDLSAEKAAINSWAAVITAISISQSSISISGSNTYQLTASTTPSGGSITWSSSNSAVATVSSSGLVTGVGNGTATITAACGGLTATCTATITGFATLSSISAVYSGGTVYTNDSLDSLKDDLVVTATYSDSSSAALADNVYTLSGTIAEGTQTITVSYQNKSTTFTVSCVVKGWLYRFNESLLSSGSEDFNLSGTGVYDTGLFDRKCYKHLTPTSGTATTDTQYGLYAKNLSEVLNFAGDFTISAWMATQVNSYAHLYDQTIAQGNTYPSNRYFSSVEAVSGSGWSIAQNQSTNNCAGLLIHMATSLSSSRGAGIGIRFSNSALTKSSYLMIEKPSSFDTTAWHHYALTRKGNTVRLFVDGSEVVHATADDTTMYNAGQCAVSTNFNTSTNNIQQMPNGEKIQDLFIANWCKWEADFDASSITY